jgi:hypothetical protein
MTGQPIPEHKQWLGVYLGIVAQTRGDTYVQVQVPQLSGFEMHTWARPMGAIPEFPPIVGTTVLVMFIAGDLQFPCYSLTA